MRRVIRYYSDELERVFLTIAIEEREDGGVRVVETAAQQPTGPNIWRRTLPETYSVRAAFMQADDYAQEIENALLAQIPGPSIPMRESSAYPRIRATLDELRNGKDA